jgi:hypothetical protein
LVDFVSSARNDHREQSSRSEDELLVAAEAQHLLTVRALQAIEAAAQDGSLLRHKDLMRILYGWRDFAGDPQVVRDWTQAQLLNDEAVVTFARGMTGESRSLGMGGFGSLGDRVSQRSASAQIDGAEEIVDIAAFKKALERIDREARFDAASLATVRTLLNVWERGSTNRRKHHQS